MTVSTEDLVDVIVKKMEEEGFLKEKTARLFYSGKEMKVGQKIGGYATKDAVISVFFRNK